MGVNNADPAIIVRLKKPYDRNFVLKSISNLMQTREGPLTLYDIGFNSDVVFNVKENLTPKNFKIYIEAVRLWKDNKVASVYTRHGIVFVKVNRSDQPTPMESINDIFNLFRPQHEE